MIDDNTVHQFDEIVATWRPKRTDNIRDEARNLVGKSATFHASWRFEDGPYEGQWAWSSRDDGWHWWVPSEDLET